MKNYKIAWRNLWRNRKRTLITIAAVFLAVFTSSFMASMQEGTYGKMIDNVVKFYSGYLQVQTREFWETSSINDVFELNDSLISAVGSSSHVTSFLPRFESFSLISTGEETKGAAVIGIDPIKENEMTGIKKWVKKGEYLKPGDDGILIAKNIAKNINAEIGDTIILLSQGYHGATAANLFPLRGILEFPSPDLNNYGTYIDIKAAQNFFSAPNKVTSMVIMLDDYDHVNKTQHHIEQRLPAGFTIKNWKELQPEVVSMIEGDRAGGMVFKAVLYVVIGFGILGTIIMMVSERRRESGIIVAIGMQKKKLQAIMFMETFYLGIIGVLVGFLISIPIMFYFLHNPIPLPDEVAKSYESFGIEPFMFFSTAPKIFIDQIIVVFIMTLLVSIYPVMHVGKLKVSSAIRGI